MTTDMDRLDAGAEAIRFVRETLGCGCPDEVVAGTVLDTSDAGEPGLDVGGRLLVRVLAPDDPDRLTEAFPAVVRRLRSERDRRGFNRVRIVVAGSFTEPVAGALENVVGAVAAGDERVHVHVIAPDAVPRVLRTPARAGSS